MIAKMENEKILNMVNLITELQNDTSVPRNVKSKLESCANALQGNVEISMRIDKARHAIEEISEDSNIQAYTRTQIWNIASLLEKL